ncbi:MAG TPA: MlaD family protein [Longimicrobiales bacterium]
MERRTRNLTALGLLVVVAGGLFIWGLFYLMGNPIWRGGTDVVLLLENGAGLKRGDRVHLYGVQVGTVRDVGLRGAETVRVDLRLDEGVRLPADTRAALQSDVFGSNTVNLVPGTALVRLEEGDTIRGMSAQGLTEIVADLSDKVRAVLTGADSLLSARTIADVQATAAVLPSSAEALRAAFVELKFAAQSLRRTAEAVEDAEAGESLGRALVALEGSAEAFTSAARTMERSLGSLESVLDKIDRGQGTLGRLVNDSSVYNELNGALREVRLLAADVRERPGRYVTIDVF